MTAETPEAREIRLSSDFYHVTTRGRLASLVEHGFDARFSRTGNGLLYLSLDLGHALGYAGHHGDAEEAVVLRIPGHLLAPEALGPDDVDLPDLLDDDADWEDHDWLSSARISGQLAFEGAVPVAGVTGKPCPDGVPSGEWLDIPALAEACAPASSSAP